MRQKQNKYPILFLTQGVSDQYPELMDIRCQTTQIAISFAQSENILVNICGIKPNIYPTEVSCFCVTTEKIITGKTAQFNV